MNGDKTRVFLTGATGMMGSAGLKELLKYPEEYEVTVLARKSKKNIKILTPFLRKGVKVIWGDLLDPHSIEKGAEESDIILHVGGMVSPAADRHPKETIKVNIGSMQLICRVVKKIEETEIGREIKVVYIGSVSQYGSHLPPEHWKGVGSPLSAAKFDAYAYSKIESERILATAGLRKWVSLRQTGILHPGLLTKTNDPIMFHVPLRGVLEWINIEDSGRLLEKVCRKGVPESFWNDFYNIGGGESYRLTNYEFEKKLLKALECPPPEKIFEPHWFATKNFHGVWFTDSDRLESILHYRTGKTFDEYMIEMKKQIHLVFKLAPLAPAFIIKKFMKKVALQSPLGPLSWIKNNDEKRIEAFWGGFSNLNKKQNWQDLDIEKTGLKFENYKNKFSNDENIDKTLTLKTCTSGHRYLTSPWLEIHGGFGCPECLKIETEISSPFISHDDL